MGGFRSIAFLLCAVAAAAGATLAVKAQTPPPGERSDGGRPAASVSLGKAERRTMPVRLEAIGTVQAVASVTVRSRVDSQITEVLVEDGAVVKQGQTLFRLDARQIDALLKQSEANQARDKASLLYAESDLRRQEELAKRDIASEQKLDNSRTLVATLRATAKGNEAAIETLRVQLSYFTITAPIPGRIGAIGIKAGNIARSGDNALTLATINQTMPIYVSFAIPQRYLPDIRDSMKAGTARVLAIPQGYAKSSEGKIAFIDNAVDATTGTITLRAQFDNQDENLWPGALCAVRVILRDEPNMVVVPRESVQSSQTGSLVYIIEDGVARVRNVVVNRMVDNETVLTSGLEGNETVVTDGQLLLTDGAKVVIKGSHGQPAGQPSSQLPSQIPGQIPGQQPGQVPGQQPGQPPPGKPPEGGGAVSNRGSAS